MILLYFSNPCKKFKTVFLNQYKHSEAWFFCTCSDSVLFHKETNFKNEIDKSISIIYELTSINNVVGDSPMTE